MKIDVLTLFPGFFSGFLESSLLGKAIAKGLLEVDLHQIRDWATDKHKTVDDTPYGGGHGMVMKPEPLVAALEAVTKPGARRILLSARGPRLTQARVKELSTLPHLVLVCGRYEGVDERIADYIDEEVTLGDYVLSGGEAGATVLIDAVSRLIPGVLGNAESLDTESFSEPLLEYPQYTRPEVFRGKGVPEILLSGNHAAVDQWRREQSIERTKRVRPDLIEGDPRSPGGKDGKAKP